MADLPVTPELIERIARSHPDHTVKGDDGLVRSRYRALPFYRRFTLLTVATGPRGEKKEVCYADDGKDLIYLDGSLQTLFTVNARDGLSLSRTHVVPYLRFLFRHTAAGEFEIVEDASEISWAERIGHDAAARKIYEQAVERIHPAQVTTTGCGNFRAAVTGTFQSLLVDAVFDITPSGTMQPIRQRLLVQGLPLAQSVMSA